MVGAQQNSVHPQPRAGDVAELQRRPPPTRTGECRNPRELLPNVPAGFSVASYAELRGPRMMVYAPNGDLFVSSPSTNSIVVLRDANNDGVFEARGVFADGNTAPAPPLPPAAADGRPAPVLGVLEGPQALVANPPAVHAAAGRSAPGAGRIAAAVWSRIPRRLPVRRQHRLDRALRIPERRPGGAGRAGEAARPADRRTLDPQHRVQSRRNEAVHRGGLGVEQRRRRRLPPRGDSGSQSRRHRRSRLRVGHSQSRGTDAAARNRCACGPRPTNATTWATISCPTTRRR